MTCANPTCTTEVPRWMKRYRSPTCRNRAGNRAKMDRALDTERCRLQKPAKAVQHMHDRQVVARARKAGAIR